MVASLLFYDAFFVAVFLAGLFFTGLLFTAAFLAGLFFRGVGSGFWPINSANSEDSSSALLH